MFEGHSNGTKPSEQSFQRPTKRPRVLVACLRCKARRQKCDNQSPACSNCAKAKLSCVFAENEYPASYVKVLENRIAWLETSLQSSQSQQSPDYISAKEKILVPSPEDRVLQTGSDSNTAPNLANSVGFLSLQAAAEPRYFGVSSGVSLAHMIEAAVYKKSRPASTLSLPAETDNLFSSNAPVTQTPVAPLPSLEKGAHFVESYLSYIHPSFPFLSRQKLWEIHQRTEDLENMATEEGELDFIMLQLVYAIGSRCLQLVGSPRASGVEPEGHYVAAMAKIQDKLNMPSVQNIQIMLLVAIYALRSPSGSSVWHLCGLMIRQCLELGLHRQLRADEESMYSDELKKRLFWSIYHLERRISLVLGRPFAISDDEINISLPLDVEEDAENFTESPESGYNHRIPKSPVSGLSPTTRTSLSFHVHLIQLDQLNTKSRLSLCRLAKAALGAKAENKIAKRFEDLENWKIAIFGSSSENSSKESAELMSTTARTPVQTPISQPAFQEHERLALLLNYHRARRMLLQTILTDVKLPNRTFEFASFAKSSGEVCQLNRRLHRLNSVPFTLLDLHSVFVAGFSMVYCAWTDPELYDAEMAADFGACSTVLYVIAEQWASAKKYRDAFELVAEKTAEYVLSTGRSRQSGQRVVPPNQESEGIRNLAGSMGGVMPLNDNSLGHTTQHHAFDTERNWNEDWANDSFDVWQMMNQFVQTQDCNVEYEAVKFTGIEELLAEEGLSWFYGNTSTGI